MAICAHRAKSKNIALSSSFGHLQNRFLRLSRLCRPRLDYVPIVAWTGARRSKSRSSAWLSVSCGARAQGCHLIPTRDGSPPSPGSFPICPPTKRWRSFAPDRPPGDRRTPGPLRAAWAGARRGRAWGEIFQRIFRAPLPGRRPLTTSRHGLFCATDLELMLRFVGAHREDRGLAANHLTIFVSCVHTTTIDGGGSHPRTAAPTFAPSSASKWPLLIEDCFVAVQTKSKHDHALFED